MGWFGDSDPDVRAQVITPLPPRLTDNVLFVQIMSRFSPPPYFSLPVIQVQVNERLFPEHMLIINVNDNNSIQSYQNRVSGSEFYWSMKKKNHKNNKLLFLYYTLIQFNRPSLSGAGSRPA